MKVLAIEKQLPGTRKEQFTQEILEAEASKAWEMYQVGMVRELYFHKDEHYAVLVLECKDTEEAHEVLSELPLVKEKLITFDIIPLVPYPGFARLFTDKK